MHAHLSFLEAKYFLPNIHMVVGELLLSFPLYGKEILLIWEWTFQIKKYDFCYNLMEYPLVLSIFILPLIPKKDL